MCSRSHRAGSISQLPSMFTPHLSSCLRSYPNRMPAICPGDRPALPTDRPLPHPGLIEIMETNWDDIPDKRLTAVDSIEPINQVLKKIPNITIPVLLILTIIFPSPSPYANSQYAIPRPIKLLGPAGRHYTVVMGPQGRVKPSINSSRSNIPREACQCTDAGCTQPESAPRGS